MDREIKEQVESLLADSRLAFIQGKNEEALKLANEVMKLDKTHPDAYLCAGNAYMSFGQYDKAVECYRNAVKYDSGNGDRYFHLGYALSANKKEAEGLAAFAKADEIGTSPEVAGEMYKILGMICFDMRSYNDAIINLCKAETIIGIDMDILQRTIDEANGISTIEEYMDKMALSKEWGNRNVVKVARVKKGTEVTHAIGTAKAQTKISDPRPGNGKQILFSKFDSNWITEVRNIKE